MSRDRDDRDVDEEFARLLEGEGVRLDRCSAPHELPESERRAAAIRRASADPADVADEGPSASARERARAAHPSAGAHPSRHVWRGGDRDPDLTDDEVIYGDFEAPDPDLAPASSKALWSWTGLLCGIAIMFAVVFIPVLSGMWAGIGAGIAIVSLVSLLSQAPRRPRGGDGAEV